MSSRGGNAGALRLLLAGTCLCTILPSTCADALSPDAAVKQMLDDARWMVGQVTMVGIWGNNFDGTAKARGKWTQTQRLVRDHHVGSVILFEGNFSNVPKPGLPSTPEQVALICNELQRHTREAAAAAGLPTLPLFVAVDHEGDTAWTRVRSGVTQVPSKMAVGATWDLGFAERVGWTVGNELTALGVNMVLGPVLDINADTSKDAMGERCFGGDPCWAGRMGQAYIRGLHRGAADRGRGLAAVAKHWPGHGDCDRLPDFEVARLGSTIDQVAEKELVPFLMAVNSSDPASRPDGLMPTHSVYTSLQAGEDPLPITLDSQGHVIGTLTEAAESEGSDALIEEMAGVEQWRQQGILVSDALDVEGLEDEYRRRGHQDLPYADVALLALLAGQDIVMLAGSTMWREQIAVLDHLADTYARGRQPDASEQDRRFAERVQDAARRVIAAKLRLLTDETGAFPEAAWAAEDPAVLRQLSAGHVKAVYGDPESPWHRAVQWIAGSEVPTPPADANVVTVEPAPSDRAAGKPMDQGLLADLIAAHYPRTGGATVKRLTVRQVRAFLSDEDTAAGEAVGSALANAQWLVIALMHHPRTPSGLEERGGIDTVRWSVRLLRELPTLFPGSQAKRVAVVATKVPYLLEVSDVAAVDAYIATHSILPRYVNVAVDSLFGSHPRHPLASPVSVPGAGYDLADALAPASGLSGTLTYTAPTSAADGGLQVGPLLDAAGRPVPDGTEVQFLLELSAPPSGQTPPRLSANTLDGVANCIIAAKTPGQLAAVSAVVGGLDPVRIDVRNEQEKPTLPLGYGLLAVLLLATAVAAWYLVARRRGRDYTRMPEVVYTILAVDVRDSTGLKAGSDPMRVRRTFDAYHEWVRRTVALSSGEVYSTSGDGVLCRFARATEGLSAARSLQESIDEFNGQANQLSRPLTVGLGLHTGPMLAADAEEHGTVSSATLDIAMKLQAHARPGEVLVSGDTAARLSPEEELEEVGPVVGETTAYRIQ